MVNRFECLQYLSESMGDALVFIWGTARDEWWHVQQNPSMTTALGYATAVGIGAAIGLPDRRIVVIDTDGGLLFNMGVLATLGNYSPPNLKIFVMDNECYESIGGMPSGTAGKSDLAAVARGNGVEHSETVKTLEEFKGAVDRSFADNNLYFIVAKVEKASVKLPPHNTDGIESKYKFVRYVEETEKINILFPPQQKAP